MTTVAAAQALIMNAVLKPKLTLQEYLDWENAQEGRHEFVQGSVLAMTEIGRIHGRVLLNLASHLAAALAGTRCQVFITSMKVQTAEDTVLYPDVFVTCDAADLATDQIFRAPTLVIEVLSPSTQAYDRSHKFALYRRISALREYVLVDPDTRRVEAFRRNAVGDWMLHDMSDDDAFVAASLDLIVAMTDVFAGIDPPPGPA